MYYKFSRCCYYQHWLLWRSQAFFVHSCGEYCTSCMWRVIDRDYILGFRDYGLKHICTILHAHKLWGAFVLQSGRLKTRILFAACNLHTALIVSRQAHSLRDHDTHQPVT
ncbi:TPA: hypothetical protein ACH3X1_007070 [Trebouxia sp. C0004]